jgi:Sulfotransferase family
MNSSPTTLQQLRPQLPVRLFNGFGALLEKSRIPPTRLFASDLIESAKRRSSLDDFGEVDFSEALSRLLESCQDEGRLNLIGRIALKTDVLEILSARLQIERDRQLYPDITRQEIREPLFILGLPRSGTSVLQRLLGADPEHRSPLMWEVRSPSPPTHDDEKRRIQRARQSCNFFNWLVPTFRHAHTVGAEVPQ